MTKAEAAALRAKWKERVDPTSCQHHDLTLEIENGYFTGDYSCIVCGESVARRKP